MQLVQTNKRYIPNKVFLGVPPTINNERCINVEFKNGLIFLNIVMRMNLWFEKYKWNIL